MQQGGDFFVPELLEGFDQTGDPCGAIEMTDVGFSRSEHAEFIRPGPSLAEGLGQRCHFDGVSQRRACAMRLDIRNLRRTDTGRGLGQGDDPGLCVDPGSGETDLVRAVIVDGPPLDDPEDRIAIGDGVAEAFQKNHSAAVTKNRAGRIRIKSAAGAIRRDHALFFKPVITLLWKADRDAAGQRHVALIREQSGGGLADGYQRGRAGGLDRHARTAQVQLVRNPDRQEILVVSEHGLVFADLIVFRKDIPFL